MRVYGQRAGSSTSDSFQEEINEASDSLFLEGAGQEAEEAETRRRRSVAAEVRRRMSADQEREQELRQDGFQVKSFNILKLKKDICRLNRT